MADVFQFPQPVGDVTGDSTGDLAVFEMGLSAPRGFYVRLLDGATLDTRWLTRVADGHGYHGNAEFYYPHEGRQLAIRGSDIDGDGTSEVILFANLGSDPEPRPTAVAVGNDGVRWSWSSRQ